MGQIICFDGYYLGYLYKELIKELDELEIVGYIYYGKDTIAEEDYKVCYSFNILINNQTSKPLWTNRKRIAEQIRNYLKKRLK